MEKYYCHFPVLTKQTWHRAKGSYMKTVISGLARGFLRLGILDWDGQLRQ